MLNNIRAVKIMKWKPFEKMWGHNPLPVPQIPKMGGVPALAEGAVLKPNAPFWLWSVIRNTEQTLNLHYQPL